MTAAIRNGPISQLEYCQSDLNTQGWNARFAQMVERFAGGNRSEFARKLGGITSTSIGNYIDKGSEPGGDVLAKTVRAYPVDAHWLLTGEGAMEKVAPDEAVEAIAEIEQTLALMSEKRRAEIEAIKQASKRLAEGTQPDPRKKQEGQD